MSEVFAGIEAALSFGSLIANVTGVSLGILFLSLIHISEPTRPY